MIAGGYGYRPRLPAIMGTEGVGRVVAVGAGVKHLKEGDRTLVPFLHPAWAERIKTDAPWLRPLPPGDIHQFAMMGVNPPTAYLLLTDIVPLPRGSWVIQNGANSGVGRATVAIAKSLGLKTVNVVRRDAVTDQLPATMRQVLSKRLTVRGFINYEFAAEHYADFLREVGAGIAAGRIRYREDIVDGLVNAPEALIGMLEGRNFGKLIVRVAF